MTASETFRPKMDRYGTIVWTGFYTNGYEGPSGGNTYVMVGADHRRGIHETSRGIAEIRQNVADGGWDVVIFGEIASRERYKTDAKSEVHSYFVSK